jgi:hypothetical protein
MHYRKGQLPILIFNLCALAVFSTFFIVKGNYEFIIYVGVIIFFLVLIIATNKKVFYPNTVLWGLTAWALMHMAGGAFHIDGTLLYKTMIIPLSETYPVLRYDQLVHIIGFGVVTLTLFYILKPLLRPDLKTWGALSIIVVASGLGVGALNEIIEFLTSSVVPRSRVGGYLNTALDLVADLIGAILALIIIRLKNKTAPINE